METAAHLPALRSTLLGALLALTGCGDEQPETARPGALTRPWVELETPTEGFVSGSGQVTVAGQASSAGPVFINGAAVPLEQGRFSHPQPLVEGSNRILVEMTGAPPVLRSGLCDTQPPVVSLTSPQRGAFVDCLGGCMQQLLAGELLDAGVGVLTATVDGHPLPPDTRGRFQAQLELPAGGITTWQIEASDRLGHTSRSTRSLLAGTFAPAGRPIEQALALFLPPAVLDALEPQLSATLSGPELAARMSGQTRGDFRIRSVRHGPVTVELQAGEGVLPTVLRVRDLQVDFETDQRILLVVVTFRGVARAEQLVLNTQLRPEVTPAGSLLFHSGHPEATLRGFSVDLEDFPGVLEDALRSRLQQLAEEELGRALRDQVLPELFRPEWLQRRVELPGGSVELQGLLRSLLVRPEGFSAELAVQVEAEQDLRVPATEMALARPQPLPPLAGPPDQVQLRISAELAESLLHQLWRAGLLHLRLSDLLPGSELLERLTVGVLDSWLGQPFRGILDPSLPLDLQLEGLLPPVLLPRPAPHRPLRLQLGDLLLHVQTRPLRPEEPVRRLFTVALAADLNCALQTSPAGVRPLLEGSLVCDLVEEPLVPLRDESVERALEQLGSLLFSLAENLELQPDLDFNGGIPLEDVRVEAHPELGGWLLFAQWVLPGVQ